MYSSVVRRAVGAALVGGGVALCGTAASPVAAVVEAQTTTGSVRGYVRDPAGAPIAGAQVTARNVQLGASRTTTSNDNGFYSLAGLRPGSYELSVRRIGLAPQTRAATVQIGQTESFDFRLGETATQLSTVTVTATADAASRTRTSEVGTNVSREQIENLPTFERNFLDLAKLAPGITATQPNDNNKYIAAGGRPAEAVNVFVDGASYKNDVLKGGVVGQESSAGNPFPQAAVQEFRVITQNYKAEYQKASSAVITATTRSGGNRWEADAFAFGISPAYVARDAIAIQRANARPNYKRLQAGGSVGGPIARDKLFFFGTYELNARDEPKYVALGGQAAQAPASLNLQNYTGQFTTQFREHLGFGKVTWLQSDRSTVDASVNVRHETDVSGFGGQDSYDIRENKRVNVYTGLANWKYAADRWLNEAQVSGQRFGWNPVPVNTNVVGRNYNGVLRIGGRDTRQDFNQDRLSLRDDITRSGVRLAGDHVFKGGANVDLLGYDVRKYVNVNPLFQYQPSNNYSQPTAVNVGFGDPKMSARNTQFGLFVQDDWTPTPKLVLNLGLRWDAETNMANNSWVTPSALRDSLTGPLRSQLLVGQPVLKPDGTCCTTVQRDVLGELGGIDNFITSGRSDRSMYLGAFQPRVGASYDVFGTGRTVVFGGFGIYYDRTYWNTLIDEQFRRQYIVRYGQPFNDVGPTPTCQDCIKYDPAFLTNPALLRQQQQLARTEVFLVKNDLRPPKSRQFSGGVRQAVGPALLTLSYNGVRGYNGTNFIRAADDVGPSYQALFVTDDRVRTWYDAFQFQVEKSLRVDTRWGGSLAYTLAHSEQQGQSDDLFWGFDNHYPTVPDLPRGRAPGNQTHAIVANGIVRLPYEVLFSTIMSFGSGIAVTATDASQGYDYGLKRTYVYQPPTRPFLGMGHVFTTQNVDFRLQKDFPIGLQRVGLAVDLFNAFGVANYGCYNGNIDPIVGKPNANFNKPDCAGLGRRLQVGLRYGYQAPSAAGTSRSR